MAFDFGFNFRNTSSYRNDDPLFCAAVLGETFPKTYTNGNGLTVNAGWINVAAVNLNDLSTSSDPKLAGSNSRNNDASDQVFKVDLGSGSAPGAGTYALDLACGEVKAFGFCVLDFNLQDNVTVLIDGTNGGLGFSETDGKYRDATVTEVISSSSWSGTPINKTFASTSLNFHMAMSTANFASHIAHLRLTQSGVVSFGSMGLFTLMGVGI